MTVIDLIIRLQQMPPNANVMLDVTPDGARAFHFKEVVEVAEVTDAMGNDFVAVASEVYGEDPEA